jgi:hypothetical protein
VTHEKLCSVKTDAGLDLISAVSHQGGGVGSRVWRAELNSSVGKNDKSGSF